MVLRYGMSGLQQASQHSCIGLADHNLAVIHLGSLRVFSSTIVSAWQRSNNSK
jgi:hypothetical protein